MPQKPTPLKRILIAEGRRQNWLSEQTGIDQATLSRIVNRGLLPSEKHAKAIAKTLKREVDELWPDLLPAEDRSAA